MISFDELMNQKEGLQERLDALTRENLDDMTLVQYVQFTKAHDRWMCGGSERESDLISSRFGCLFPEKDEIRDDLLKHYLNGTDPSPVIERFKSLSAVGTIIVWANVMKNGSAELHFAKFAHVHLGRIVVGAFDPEAVKAACSLQPYHK